MLNILEEFDVAELGFGTADSIHLLAESMKKAFADRNQYTGDPEFVEVPVDRLISKHHVEDFIDTIDMDKVSPEIEYELLKSDISFFSRVCIVCT